MWIRVQADTRVLVDGPFEEEPAATDELAVIECPIGYPDAAIWSAAANGFLDRLRPVYTFNAWVDLFPLAEQVAIAAATMSDPMAKLIYDRAVSASGSIDPADPRTREGLGYLVAKDYVSQATLDRITGL